VFQVPPSFTRDSILAAASSVGVCPAISVLQGGGLTVNLGEKPWVYERHRGVGARKRQRREYKREKRQK
jgi:hypothetical protein